MDSALVIAVVGPPRSGTSCVAGMLWKLGVDMGVSWREPNRKNPIGYFEDEGLHQLRLATYGMIFDPLEWTTPQQRIRTLRRILRQRVGDIVGFKNPCLCRMIPQIIVAWPKLKVFATERPTDDVALSGRSWWKHKLTPEETVNGVRWLYAKRDADLAYYNVQYIKLRYADILQSPQIAVDAMIDFTSIVPTAEQRQAAIEFAQPELNHWTKVK